jgi:hypothetical protein
MRIQDLTELTSLNDNDLIVVDDYQSAGVYNTKKITVANLKSELVGEYTKLVGLLSQSGTNAPTLTILENTTGATITPSRLTTGTYTLTFDTSVFTDFDKVHVGLNNFKRPYAYDYTLISSTEIQFNSWVLLTDVASDSAFNRTAIEIRIYE